MGIIELFLIGVGLSMDAFAVSICKGLNMTKINYKHAGIIALFFGGFQALMPLIGYYLGRKCEVYIESVDHWIAFGLLAFIGGQIIYEAFKGEDEETNKDDSNRLDIKQLFMLAIATSIDALAVGITFGILKGMSIWFSITLIGITTFVISFGGVIIGNKFGNKYEKRAQIAGGIILVLIGLKILLQHLGIISF